jgi:hypothetical protein
VVIHYLYIGRSSRRPHEAHAPLIIDADAVLPFAVPLQGFEPIPGRGRQIEQNVPRVQPWLWRWSMKDSSRWHSIAERISFSLPVWPIALRTKSRILLICA